MKIKAMVEGAIEMFRFRCQTQVAPWLIPIIFSETESSVIFLNALWLANLNLLSGLSDLQI
jgi:hypothetical protein